MPRISTHSATPSHSLPILLYTSFFLLKRFLIVLVVVLSVSSFLLVLEERKIQHLGRLERVGTALVHKGLGSAAEIMFIAVA